MDVRLTPLIPHRLKLYGRGDEDAVDAAAFHGDDFEARIAP